jgi:hypothetical protein
VPKAPPLAASRPLPRDFPKDFPIYKGSKDSIITDTAFERQPGSISYTVSFLTTNSRDDVMSYYRQQFQSRSWTVTDTPLPEGQTPVPSIDFTDSKQEIQGTVQADTWDEDSAYTRVDVFVDVATSRRVN